VSDGQSLPLRAWLGLFGAMRAYHRYDIVGLDRILALRGPALLVGYHGRPIAYDLCMLGVTLHERLGYLPHGIVHGAVDQQPVMKWVSDGLGFITADGPVVDDVVRRGEHICVQPGGTREGCRSFRHRYEVAWGDRTGYLQMALRHRLPIVPIAASGIDDGYVGLNDGYALGKRLGAPGRLPLWLGIGLYGPFPFSPPLPVKITQRIGEPIDLEADGPVARGDRAAVLRLHEKVKRAVQALLDEGRGQ
jgi:1-acyl-sn-glycerol-3-phosphate acyltransferase